eukprot:gene5219-5875_t
MLASRKEFSFVLLAVLVFACPALCGVGGPTDIDLNDKAKHELDIALAGLDPVSDFMNVNDIPEDNTPQGPEDEDDASASSSSGDEKDKHKSKLGKCDKEHLKPKNKATNEPSLFHFTFDNMCSEADKKKVKILPVYVVGWELKQCSPDVNVIPYKRFLLAKYESKKPRFDIPGMCIPLKGREMTLMMIDSDAPSRKNHKCRSWLHWLVVNIKKGDIKQGKEIVEYKSPSPAIGSGPHRYFFLLYDQNFHITHIDDSENNFNLRCGFSVRNFAEDNSLSGPVAINMFKTENKKDSS